MANTQFSDPPTLYLLKKEKAGIHPQTIGERKGVSPRI